MSDMKKTLVPDRVEINFEQVEPLVEAVISHNGKKVCVIYSCAPELNQITREAVRAAKDQIVRSIMKRGRP